MIKYICPNPKCNLVLMTFKGERFEYEQKEKIEIKCRKCKRIYNVGMLRTK